MWPLRIVAVTSQVTIANHLEGDGYSRLFITWKVMATVDWLSLGK